MRLLAIAAGAAFLLPSPAAATQIDSDAQCGPVAGLTDWLDRNTNETAVTVERLDDSHAVQLWRSADGATWTILLISVQGGACIIAHGKRWDRATPRADEGTEG